MVEKKSRKERLKEIFENTIDSDLLYNGNFEKIDYYNLFCKAASKDKVYNFMGVNLCMFNCKHDNKDSVMMIYYIPVNDEDTGAKSISERIIDIIDESEKCFITLPFVKSEKLEEEKFVYVIIVKDI